jgi:hypothetical protein
VSPERSRLGALFAWLIVLVLGGLGVWGFVESRGEAARDADEARHIEAPQRVSLVDGERVITLDAAAQREDGIATVALRNVPHQKRLRAYGTVLDVAPLTELANSYANAKAQLEIVKAKLAAARAAFARARTLYNDRQNISAARLQEAKAAFDVDRARLGAANSELRTLAVTAEQSWGPALGRAVVDGTPLLERLIARKDVLLQVTLQPGQAIAQPPANPSVRLDNGSRVPLHFVSAATKTDPRFQGLSFFFTAPAKSGLLPGMSVVASLASGPPIVGAVVPASAIVWEAGRAWAYFRTGPRSFARRAVATDLRAPKGGYVVQGLPDNAELVVEGAQMLLSEELRAQMNTGEED